MSPIYNLLQIASANSSVELFPPRSGVLMDPSSSTSSTALLILFASCSNPEYSSIKAADLIAAIGFAIDGTLSAISGADP